MRMLNYEKVPRPAVRVVAQEAAGQWVLLDANTGQSYTLNPVAGRVWQLCDGKRSVRQIAEVMCDEYEAAGQAVDEDVAELVTELVGESLLI
jgi:pyrroloquinoline quinone biosynthesis protein D